MNSLRRIGHALRADNRTRAVRTAARLDFIATAWRLGARSVLRVLRYRVALRLGWWRLRLPAREPWAAPLFHRAHAALERPYAAQARLLAAATDLVSGHAVWFGRYRFAVGRAPDWFGNPFASTRLSAAAKHWSEIPDFDDAVGDIKTIWEPSRFDWAPVLALAWRLTGDAVHLDVLNRWIADWLAHNPVNVGPNWKCGQECSIRLLNVLLAARFAGQDNTPADALVRFVAEHMERIRPTMAYAVGQDNNHALSEAAALFVAGAWLDYVRPSARARRCHRAGRRWLEERVLTLFEPDGSFSQYSVNYHRMALDVVNQAELWRRHLQGRDFGTAVRRRLHRASRWLQAMTDPQSGDAPNIGANDGTHLFGLAADARDFRPTVQMSLALWAGARAYPPGVADGLVDIFAVSRAERPQERPAEIFPDGGYAVLEGANPLPRTWAVLRFPRYRFRPSHADALHLDVWADGENLVRDGGTYTYGGDTIWRDYFAGTASHSTVRFDGEDQMPRLGRFLFGRWLTTERVERLAAGWAASYVDDAGRRHRRAVSATPSGWTIVDDIEGHEREAELRWRLAPVAWRLQRMRCASDLAAIEVRIEAGTMRRAYLADEWESRHYLERTALPVFTVTLGPGPARLVTEIALPARAAAIESDEAQNQDARLATLIGEIRPGR